MSSFGQTLISLFLFTFPNFYRMSALQEIETHKARLRELYADYSAFQKNSTNDPQQQAAEEKAAANLQALKKQYPEIAKEIDAIETDLQGHYQRIEKIRQKVNEKVKDYDPSLRTFIGVKDKVNGFESVKNHLTGEAKNLLDDKIRRYEGIEKPDRAIVLLANLDTAAGRLKDYPKQLFVDHAVPIFRSLIVLYDKKLSENLRYCKNQLETLLKRILKDYQIPEPEEQAPNLPAPKESSQEASQEAESSPSPAEKGLEKARADIAKIFEVNERRIKAVGEAVDRDMASYDARAKMYTDKTREHHTGLQTILNELLSRHRDFSAGTFVGLAGKIDKPQTAGDIAKEIETLREGWALNFDEKQSYKNEMQPALQQQLKAYQQHLRSEQERWNKLYKDAYHAADAQMKRIFPIKAK